MARIVGKDEKEMRRVTCRACASIVEYTMSETVTRWVGDYGGDREHIRELQCPGCINKILVKFY
jgi:hypothetical protein